MRTTVLTSLLLLALSGPSASGAPSSERWVVSWTASMQGPYPIGNPLAQPDLSLAFPSA
jgi:hypothetical protein